MDTAKKTASFAATAAVMSGFFVMGFVDLVGQITKHVQTDPALGFTPKMASFLSSAIFIWFFVCAVPTSMLMNRLGRKKTVLLSLFVTAAAFALPLISYTTYVLFAAMALLGIGNAIIQVALNPLVSNVVAQEKLTSSLTFGQFTKAVASFVGPFVVAFAAEKMGGFKMIFPLYAVATLVSAAWLMISSIPKEETKGSSTSVFQCLALLSDKRVFALFAGILAAVGFDVGINVYTSGLDTKAFGMPLTSVYFAARTVGAFLGAFLLAKLPIGLFFKASTALVLAALAGMLKFTDPTMLGVFTALAGFGGANIFSMIFGWAMQHKPSKANEVSGLLIMGVAGGGIAPPLMAFVNPVYILLGCMAYLLGLAILYRAAQSK